MNRPQEIDLDGHVDDQGIQYFGKASLQPNGRYICLADIEGRLCRVEVQIKITIPTTLVILFTPVDYDPDYMPPYYPGCE